MLYPQIPCIGLHRVPLPQTNCWSILLLLRLHLAADFNIIHKLLTLSLSISVVIPIFWASKVPWAIKGPSGAELEGRSLRRDSKNIWYTHSCRYLLNLVEIKKQKVYEGKANPIQKTKLICLLQHFLAFKSDLKRMLLRLTLLVP